MLRHDAREGAIVQLGRRPQIDPSDGGALVQDEADVGWLARAHDVNLLHVVKYLSMIKFEMVAFWYFLITQSDTCPQILVFRSLSVCS